jgi:hypothetical protein
MAMPGMYDDLPIGDMNETEFEEFCFDLLRELGFVNLDWRKGQCHVVQGDRVCGAC